MISVKGPDVRWCGNEAGNTRSSEFNVIPLENKKLEDEQWPDRHGSPGALKNLAGAKRLHYYPAEVNTSIRHGWFFRNDDEQKVRDADNLFDIYERAVGGNAVFLLNIPPNREGKFSQRDVDSLIQVGKRIIQVYEKNLNTGLTGPLEVLDGNEETYWCPDKIAGSFEITLPNRVKANRVMIQEAISVLGQRVEKHALDAWVDKAWKEIASAGAIGYKRILRFPPTETSRFRIRIIESRAIPAICSVSIHNYNEPPNPVEIRVGKDNSITIVAGIAAFSKRSGFKANSTQNIYYTLDGSEPTIKSKHYNGKFKFPNGGIIKARTILENKKGVLTSRLIGYPKNTWKLLSCDSVERKGRTDAHRAFDNSTGHAWMSKKSKGEHYIAVDMGKEQILTGFTYMPPNPGKKAEGMVEKYRIEMSKDGSKWTTVQEGEFGNIINDPSMRVVYFDKLVKSQYFKFVSLRSANSSQSAGIREIDMLGLFIEKGNR